MELKNKLTSQNSASIVLEQINRVNYKFFNDTAVNQNSLFQELADKYKQSCVQVWVSIPEQDF